MIKDNSLCCSCENKNICKKFDSYLLDYNTVIIIKECKNYNGITNNNDLNVSCTPSIKSKIDVQEDVSNNTSLYTDYSNSSKIDNDTQIDKIDNKNSIKGDCPICDSKNVKLIKCNKCGKEVCNDCCDTFVDMDTNKVENICYSCSPKKELLELSIDSFIDDNNTLSYENFIKDKEEKKKSKTNKSNKKDV